MSPLGSGESRTAHRCHHLIQIREISEPRHPNDGLLFEACTTLGREATSFYGTLVHAARARDNSNVWPALPSSSERHALSSTDQPAVASAGEEDARGIAAYQFAKLIVGQESAGTRGRERIALRPSLP